MYAVYTKYVILYFPFHFQFQVLFVSRYRSLYLVTKLVIFRLSVKDEWLNFSAALERR